MMDIGDQNMDIRWVKWIHIIKCFNALPLFAGWTSVPEWEELKWWRKYSKTTFQPRKKKICMLEEMAKCLNNLICTQFREVDGEEEMLESKIRKSFKIRGGEIIILMQFRVRECQLRGKSPSNRLKGYRLEVRSRMCLPYPFKELKQCWPNSGCL